MKKKSSSNFSNEEIKVEYILTIFLPDEDISLSCEMADMSISGFFEWDF